MTRIVLLDTGPLGLITNPSDKGQPGAAKAWCDALRRSGTVVRVPQIADYELRRGLVLKQFTASIALLNQLIRQTNGVIPVDAKVWRKAAEFWAQCRRPDGPGQTDHDKALDGDMILCATAWSITRDNISVEVATTNVADLEHFVEAKLWSDIS